MTKEGKRIRQQTAYSLCIDCGKEMFPNADTNRMSGITISSGTCPGCLQKNVTLIPIIDFENATRTRASWD